MVRLSLLQCSGALRPALKCVCLFCASDVGVVILWKRCEMFGCHWLIIHRRRAHIYIYIFWSKVFRQNKFAILRQGLFWPCFVLQPLDAVRSCFPFSSVSYGMIFCSIS